ncbi:MAG: hypothetical protein ACLUKN_07540 [Bacilli bacterium]
MSRTDASLIWRQAILAVLAGSMTGILATAVLPIIERIFQCYSNIALIEYTDFNNPLLRRLQIEAPEHTTIASWCRIWQNKPQQKSTQTQWYAE